MEKTHKIGIVGCGVVGAGLVSLLNDKREALRTRWDFDFKLCFVSDYARGTLVSPDGLDTAAITHALSESGNLHALPDVRREPVPLEDILKETPVDFVCDATPTNYETGQPSLGILRTALESGANAVTCSKGGVGKDLAGLKKIAQERGVSLRFESSVLSGTPLINLVRGPLAGCEVSRVQGIVNGTTNYILTKMGDGATYDAALADAQRLGYAEADPTGDVEGFDAAVKVCIMAGEFFGATLSIGDVDRTGITKITAAHTLSAVSNGRCIKLIAGVERTEGGVSAYVRPIEVDSAHPLAAVSGVTNAVSIRTDNLGEITIIGPGAGARETAQGILSDMLEIARR